MEPDDTFHIVVESDLVLIYLPSKNDQHPLEKASRFFSSSESKVNDHDANIFKNVSIFFQ